MCVPQPLGTQLQCCLPAFDNAGGLMLTLRHWQHHTRQLITCGRHSCRYFWGSIVQCWDHKHVQHVL